MVRMEKMRTQLDRRRLRLKGAVPTGESLSKVAGHVERIAIALIKEDPDFINTRIQEDVLRPNLSANEGQLTESLETSMEDDGLKVPIVVEEGPDGVLWMRAGFRRWRRAIRLGWKEIPAIVLPRSTPKIDAYWFNILENTTRKPLTTYEAARAAQLMRDEFGVSPTEFSKKTGYSIGYVSKLLSCIDRLPDELKEQWMVGGGLSIDEWYRLSLLDPLDAIKYFRRWTGQRPRDPMLALETREPRQRKIPPAWLAERMQRLYEGVEGSDLEPKVRSLALMVVEVCMNTRDLIPGVYDPRRRVDYERKARLRAELRMPEVPDPGEEGSELPAPRGALD